jgi:hypothetical protein
MNTELNWKVIMSYRSITEEEVKLRILLNATEFIQFKRKAKRYERHQWNNMHSIFKKLLINNSIKFDYEYRIKLEGNYVL